MELNKQDFGTPELHRRKHIEKRRGIAYVTDSSLLHSYLTHGLIDEIQFFAGQRLQSQWYFAGNDRTAKSKATHLPGQSAGEKFEKRYKSACKSMRLVDMKIVSKVCIYDERLKDRAEIKSFVEGIKDLAYYYEYEENKLDFD